MNHLGTTHLQSRRLVIAAVFCAILGCKSDDNASPERAVRTMVEALYRGDVTAVRRLMVSPGRLSQALSCNSKDLVSELEEALNAIERMINSGFVEGMTIKIKSVTETGRRSIAAGDLYRGCTATEPFEVRSFEMRKHAVKGDMVNDSQETIDVLRMGGVWYVMLNHSGE